MINYDVVTKENANKHNLNWPPIPEHPYTMSINGSFGSGKRNALLNLIKQQDYDDYSIIENISANIKDPYGAIYQHLIKNVKLMVQRLLLNIKIIFRMFMKT